MKRAEDFAILKQTISGFRPELIALQTLLSSIPAVAPESGGDGESEKCAALENWLVAHGITQLEHFDAPDSRVSSGVRPNLVASVPGAHSGTEKDRTVWILAHLDVVPPGDASLWRTNPWRVVYDEKTDCLFGRGVEDNQQGLVSGVCAALAFIKNGILPEYTVKLLFMADEECGSEYGIQFLLKHHRDMFRKEDLILIPDGGDAAGETIEIAEKNILWLRLHTKGLQSHGSMPDKGKNAFLAGCDLALRLHKMEECFDGRDSLFSPDRSTFQPTKKEPNVETVNIIPGDDVFYMDCRILPRYTLDEVRSEVASRVAAVEKQYGVQIEVSEMQAQQSPATARDAPVVQKLSVALKEVRGIEARLVGIGGGTVGAELRKAGFSAAVWSTIDEVCHQPNEYCRVQNIIDDATTLAGFFLI